MAEQTIEGWPPPDDRGGSRGRKRGSGGARDERPPLIVLVAGGLAILVLLVAVAMGVSGKLGVTGISSEEVAVKVNYVTGSMEIIQQPGYALYLPFLEEIYTFDRTTQQFQMEGNRYLGWDHVPLLTVRASDGSNFRINDLTILYELIPGEAGTILEDSGPSSGYKEEWIKSFARSILRDEFGRYTAVEVADPTTYKQAPAAATRRLNEVLEPHGIRVVRINTPNPQFDPEYEQAIEDRKEFDQEVERLIAEAERLEQLRAQRLAAVAKEKEVEQQRLGGDLKKALLAAQERKIAVTKEADVFATRRLSEGQAGQQEFVNQARGLEAKYSKEAEGIASRARALEQRGEVVVREALVEKLKSVAFTLIPYSRDPAPARLEHEDARDPVTESGTQGGGMR